MNYTPIAVSNRFVRMEHDNLMPYLHPKENYIKVFRNGDRPIRATSLHRLGFDKDGERVRIMTWRRPETFKLLRLAMRMGCMVSQAKVEGVIYNYIVGTESQLRDVQEVVSIARLMFY